MSLENDFLPFAVGSTANVLTQTAYAASTALVQNGFASGIAQSAQLNKVWRQSSIMAAVLAQFIVANAGQPAIDDGTTATLLANFCSAIGAISRQTPLLVDTGAANAYSATNAVPLVSSTWVDGVVQMVKIANANTGASTYSPDGLAAIPIYGLGLKPLQGGELVVGGTAMLMRSTINGVNSGNPICVLIECSGGASQIVAATASSHAVRSDQLQQAALVYAIDSGTANTYQASYTPPVTALTDGMTLSFRAKNANTGASTFSPNGLVAKPIYSQAHDALLSGEIAVNGFVEVEWNSALNGWVLCENSGGIAHGITPAVGDNSQKLATTAFVQASLLGAAFGSSLVLNGYKKLPDPNSPTGQLIIQHLNSSWTSSGVNQSTTRNFPIAFPNTCYFAIVGGANNGTDTGTPTQWVPNTTTKTQVGLYCSNVTSAFAQGFSVLAIGY